MGRLRGTILAIAGQSWPVRVWARWRCRAMGVSVRRSGDALELRKGVSAILLTAKHAFFAPQVARDFEAFASAFPTGERDGVRTTDYAADPNALNVCRRCLELGATIEHRGREVWLCKGERVMVLAVQHYVYVVDMAEKFELYYTPLVPEMRAGLQVLDYSQPGRLQTYARSGLQFEMASFPEEEEAIEEYFRWYRPKAGDVVFDVGAHCGVSTYHLSKLVGPEGRVVCFEPDPVNFEILKRNLERHGLSNVSAQHMALAGTSGKLAFNSEGTIGSSLVSALLRDSVGSVVMVDALTLGEVCERFGVPAFCKIDIEGAEVDVLRHAEEVLRKNGVHLAIDTHHPRADGKMTTEDVEAVLRGYGYEVASEANPLWTTWARPR